MNKYINCQEKFYVSQNYQLTYTLYAEINFVDEIKSMAFDGDTIAVVTAKEGKLDSQKLFLYDSRGIHH